MQPQREGEKGPRKARTCVTSRAPYRERMLNHSVSVFDSVVVGTLASGSQTSSSDVPISDNDKLALMLDAALQRLPPGLCRNHLPIWPSF
jgi:hypothetical protein